MKPKTINIPSALLDEWQSLRTSSDFGIIAAQAEVYPQVIYKAFETGSCAVDVFEYISDFYKGKKELLEKYISDYNE